MTCQNSLEKQFDEENITATDKGEVMREKEDLNEK